MLIVRVISRKGKTTFIFLDGGLTSLARCDTGLVSRGQQPDGMLDCLDYAW